MKEIILASSSPRRKELLERVGIPFKIFPVDIEESYPSDINSLDVSSYIAGQKALEAYKKLPENLKDHIILAADTVICYNDMVLGKASDALQAKKYIKMLQGKTHRAVSAIALYDGKNNKLNVKKSVCKVEFNSMSEEEINWYIKTEEWKGVAAAYRIQGKASLFIKKIEGSDSCVMGLPLFELYDMLREYNYSIF